MQSKFFTKKQSELVFEWNTASNYDWPIIKRNFVAAYISSYQDRTLEELQYTKEEMEEAEKFFDAVYQKTLTENYDTFENDIIKPLQFYLFTHSSFCADKNDQKFQVKPRPKPLSIEADELKRHFSNEKRNVDEVSGIRQYLTKLLMLKKYFENDFHEEMHKIAAKAKPIDYLIVRFHGRPIAFFVCEVNYKSAHVYLRFVTIEPAYHNEGLGRQILDHIVQRYPEATGLELYTRNANVTAKIFYQQYKFKPCNKFSFNNPTLNSQTKDVLFFPDDDKTSHPECFIAFSKLTHYYRG